MENNQLVQVAERIRAKTLAMVKKAQGGHLGGSLSALEMLVALYYGIMRIDPKNPRWDRRDRFILSKAHACQSLYAILADLGFFPEEELDTFLKDGSRLGNHSSYIVPGIEVAGGSLGHGLGLACGMAWAARMDGKTHRVYCMIGDGESQEGSIWEAAMFAAQHQLANLVAITDYNQLGSEDFVENTADIHPLYRKWQAFKWDVRLIDGLTFDDIMHAFYPSPTPTMIIASTVKGRGTSLENYPQSHHHIPRELKA